MDCWLGCEQVILVDATAPRGTPGQVQVWDAHADRLSEDVFPCSTHAFGVRQAVELARAMNRLPQILLIYGIEGKQFFWGAPPSPEVERAVVSVAERLEIQVASGGVLHPATNTPSIYPLATTLPTSRNHS